MKQFLTFAMESDVITPLMEAYGAGAPASSGGKPGDGKPGQGQPGQGQPGQGQPRPHGKGTPVPVAGPGPAGPGPGESPIAGDMITKNKTPKPLDGSDNPNTEETELERVDEIVREALRRVKEQADASSNQISDEQLEKLGVVSRQWATVLRNMLGRFRAPDQHAYQQVAYDTFVRTGAGLSRTPGKVTNLAPKLGNILIAIDTSGSMTQKMLGKCCSVIEQIAKQRDISKGLGIIRIVFYTTEPWSYQDFDPKVKTSKIVAYPTKTAGKQSGGNDWGRMIEQMFTSKGFKDNITGKHVDFTKSIDRSPPITKFHGFIFLTDGGEWANEEKDRVPTSFVPKQPFVLCLTEGVTTWNHDFVNFVKNADKSAQIINVEV